MGASPTPAELEYVARWKPTMSEPMAPPATPSGENAWVTISTTAAGMLVTLAPSTIRQLPT